MGCMNRRRDVEVRPEQKWDYITLGDFKSTSCWTPFAYGYLWFSLLISTTVYSLDTFTAVQLLVFNKWSSEIEPTQLIPFDVTKWVFSICIILSFINLGYEHVRARRTMNRGSVAESYLDNLAVRLESVRLGKGRGWKRFLVFAELTKSKKGAEYVALFTYFSFQSWLRVLICSGPRQVVNAFTLYSVYRAQLEINGDTFESSLMNFFSKIKALATQDYQQALVLSAMLFTFVIWLVSFLSLMLAAVFFVFFLWHYIPREDGGLSGFCERKASKRLLKIVSVKIKKAMADDERKRRKAEFKTAKKNGGDRPISLKATLPNVEVAGDKLPEMPTLYRNDTMSTLPPYTSRPGTPGSIELNSLEKRPMPSRTATTATTASSTSQFSSRAPLLSSAADFGVTRTSSPAPTLPTIDMNIYAPSRTGTAASNRTFGGPPGPQSSRMPTSSSLASSAGFPSNSNPYSGSMPPMPPSIRSPIDPSSVYRSAGPTPVGGRPTMDEYDRRMAPVSSRPMLDEYSSGRASPAPTRTPVNPPGAYRDAGPASVSSRPTKDEYDGRSTPISSRPTADEYSSGRASPAPSMTSYRSGPQSPGGPQSPRSMGPGGYPQRSATNPMPPRGPQPYAPQRNMTAPLQQQPTGSNSSLRNVSTADMPYQQPGHQNGDFDYYNYYNRPGTANSQRSTPQGGYGNGGWNQDIERGPGPRARY